MNFVFYDTETTGIVQTFDQILQFAAIMTNDKFVELDRFEIRCRRLPWVVPAPMAMKVTNITPALLEDPTLPSHYEMMREIHTRLEAWSPSIFIGYNSMRFDEPLLQQAFWQALYSPYLTVTKGNSRLDILPLVQAASHLKPDTLNYPKTGKGKIGFKLDQLAPLNGFAHEHAHDALADVEATIHIAKILSDGAPDLWRPAVKRTKKEATANIVLHGAPILVVEHFPWGPSVWFGQRLDSNSNKGSYAKLARLDTNWRGISSLDDNALFKALSASPKPVRQIALNKAPIVYAASEASAKFSISPDEGVISQSNFLRANPSFADKLAIASEKVSEPWPKGEHVEQMIFDGFLSPKDEKLIDKFHRSNWKTRAELVHLFQDQRLRQLAQRLVYVSAPELLSDRDVRKIEAAIKDRLTRDGSDPKLWRSIPAAQRELAELDGTREATVIGEWLDKLAERWN